MKKKLLDSDRVWFGVAGVWAIIVVLICIGVYILMSFEYMDMDFAATRARQVRIEKKVDKLIELGEKWNNRMVNVEDVEP